MVQGREQEWMFGAEEGQWQVAASCRSQRVVLVSLRRGLAYGDLDAIKAELSPLVSAQHLPGRTPIPRPIYIAT